MNTTSSIFKPENEKKLKTQLLAWATAHSMTEIILMNLLQEHGLVSDSAIMLDDCCEKDLKNCVFHSLSDFKNL